MKIYLVGGAVRNQLLKLPVSDYDWVVVGAKPDDLIKFGFKQIGKGFPVFLNPKTQEEYALARIDRKIGKGYSGFSCFFDSKVTIEEDLSRRDLTINSIARSEDGKIIDPYNGLIDIKKRVLRHISSSFVEDPLRILRVARFYAQLSDKKFRIDNQTKLLMKKMVQSQELNSISSNRIWKETEKALCSSSPELYFYSLYKCGALFFILFKKIDKIPRNIKFSFLVLKYSTFLTQDISVRFAAFFFDLINFLYFFKKYDYFLGSKISKNFFIEKICFSFSVPNKIKELVKISFYFYEKIQNIDCLDSANIVNFFNKIDIWRKPERMKQIFLIIKAKFISENKRKKYYLKCSFFIKAFKIIRNISNKDIFKKDLKGIEIKNEINEYRIKKLDDFLNI